jgi:hypothetical protein
VALSNIRTALALPQVTQPERLREMVGQLTNRSLLERRCRLPIGDPAIVNECPVIGFGFEGGHGRDRSTWTLPSPGERGSRPSSARPDVSAGGGR